MPMIFVRLSSETWMILLTPISKLKRDGRDYEAFRVGLLLGGVESGLWVSGLNGLLWPIFLYSE